MRPFAALLISMLLLSFAGCDDADPRLTDIPRQNWARQRFPDATEKQLFAAAQYAVRQWFPIKSADPEAGLITSYPLEEQERGGTGRIRDTAIHYPNRIRRRATVRLLPEGGTTVVECVVIKDRLDTADMRVFEKNRQFDDVNNQTPIQTEAATSARQNEVWSEIGRDRGMEQRILAVIRERIGGPSAPANPAPDTSQPADQ